MADAFDDLSDAMRQTAEALARANDAMVAAHGEVRAAVLGVLRTVEASREARTDRSDLRETVHRLEELVLELATEVRALRREHNGNGA